MQASSPFPAPCPPNVREAAEKGGHGCAGVGGKETEHVEEAGKDVGKERICGLTSGPAASWGGDSMPSIVCSGGCRRALL
jgi:hypothetical protein